MLTKLSLATSLLLSSSSAASTEEWKKRSVYQILTDRFDCGTHQCQPCSDLSNYCGGDWKGITKNLLYIRQILGFDAIWISPVVDNMEGGYHGYWAQDWEKTNSHFGSDDDLKELINAAHALDMFVMVDVVANHVAPVGEDYRTIKPFNNAEHYHENCDIDFKSGDQKNKEDCRLAGLPDLKQENPWVREYLKGWISNLVTTYGFDGIRIDTVPEVPKDFWTEYGQAAGVFQMGENFNGDPAYVGPY